MPDPEPHPQDVPLCSICSEQAGAAWGALDVSERERWGFGLEDGSFHHLSCAATRNLEQAIRKAEEQLKALEKQRLQQRKEQQFPRRRTVPKLRTVLSGASWHSTPSFNNLPSLGGDAQQHAPPVTDVPLPADVLLPEIGHQPGPAAAAAATPLGALDEEGSQCSSTTVHAST